MTTSFSTSLRMRSTRTPPPDILRYILLRLPVKSLLRLQSVCKEWRSLIQDSDFNHSYSHKERLIVVSESSDTPRHAKLNRFIVSSVNQNFQLEKVYYFTEHLSLLNGTYFHRRHVLGSCNGLVLLSVDTHIFLWNPSTRHCIKVLEHECLKYSVRGFASGFCYDSSRGDYKAVLLLPHFVIVASLRQKEWRQVSFPYDLLSRRASLHFRNIFHLALNDVRFQDFRYSGCEKIVYFDPVSEKFEVLPTSKVKEGGINIIGALGVIQGCLSMALYENHTIEILTMKEYGVAESWVTLYTVSWLQLLVGSYCRVTFYSLKNNVLIWYWGERKIFVIDMMTKERQNVLGGIRDENIVDTCLYVESLASPHEYTWVYEQHKHFSKKIKWIQPTFEKMNEVEEGQQ
ncbi:unnamed protein product [Cuscuta epithymum]|uniref:F-box domain-containing protein n=1 Tax=Cuscuta epithymum TaxID=186058 RepID=A0AAV0FEV5_9ASTE|nr:unnamed protein product [Cuscuta epithymum]